MPPLPYKPSRAPRLKPIKGQRAPTKEQTVVSVLAYAPFVKAVGFTLLAIVAGGLVSEVVYGLSN